ncbi:MAG: ABC transporter permease [Lachnospiraceae bacterium]|nr:ABC transporter permease [Lachnospiraceae bacterium]
MAEQNFFRKQGESDARHNIKQNTAASEEDLLGQIGEKDGITDKLRRMCKQNKLAAFSAVVILIILLMAVFAPVIAPYGEAEQDLMNRLQAPSAAHWLGTDELGRDVFSRLLYGARVSLSIGIIPSIISLLIGILLGLTAGYFGGWYDYIVMRLADVMLSVPSLLMAMVVMYTLGSSITSLFIALIIVDWASVARVVRSQTLSLKESEYVEAARSIGVRRFTIMIRHILPNCIPSLIVLFTLNVPSAILSESSLSFLGIGVQPPAASWGLIVNQAKQFLFTQPWLCLAPCIAIMIVVLAFNFLGDGLRDVLDPYMKDQ